MLLGGLAGLLLLLVLVVAALRMDRRRGPTGGPPDVRRVGQGGGPSAHEAAQRAQGKTSWTGQGL